jgi:predicted nuclease of predicted toxin-antitoxin system
MARFLIDANLPRKLSLWEGANFEWVVDHDAAWTDSTVWQYARQQDLIIVSKDADFSDRAMVSTPPPRVVQIKVGNLRLAELRQFLIEVWPAIDQAAPSHRLLVVSREAVMAIR